MADLGFYHSEHVGVAEAYRDLGQLAIEMGNVANAKTDFSRALTIYETYYPSGHERTKDVRGALEHLAGG